MYGFLNYICHNMSIGTTFHFLLPELEPVVTLSTLAVDSCPVSRYTEKKLCACSN